MSRLIDADRLKEVFDRNVVGGRAYFDMIDNAPTVETIPKSDIQKAIDKVEEYICDIETDTVKAQGMAQALDIFEQTLKVVKHENDNNKF